MAAMAQAMATKAELASIEERMAVMATKADLDKVISEFTLLRWMIGTLTALTLGVLWIQLAAQ